MLSRKEVFNDIDVEDPNSSNTWKLAVLTEELGEVAKEVVDGSNRIKGWKVYDTGATIY